MSPTQILYCILVGLIATFLLGYVCMAWVVQVVETEKYTRGAR